LTAVGPAPFTPFPVSDREFAAFQKLIYEEAGIHLSPVKKALLTGRLSKRVRELGLPSLAAYHEYVTASSPDERVHLLDCITTNETRFFREPQQFAFLEQQLVPSWVAEADAGRRPRRVRAWSAGCSTGEEPYSLAMVLLSLCPPEAGWDVEILATDVSTRALARARDACWPIERAAEIPDEHLKRCMLRGVRSQEGRMSAGPEIRGLVRFERLNLMSGEGFPGGRFDVVLCRNVLIYFDASSKQRVIERLLGRLEPGGHLFLGHAEGLGRTAGVRPVRPNVYALAAA
jgi:chemotaxis protein methyltransferase CheR